MNNLFKLLVVVISIYNFLLVSNSVYAATTPIRLGVIGDSRSDEYRGTDNRGGNYSSVTLNWLEILVDQNKVNMGKWSNWGGVRREGYEYNWASSGATSKTLIQQGQHTQLLSQIKQQKIDFVIIDIGTNDFAPYNPQGFPFFYNATSSQISVKLTEIKQNYVNILDTVTQGNTIPILLLSVSSWEANPLVMQQFPDSSKRLKVTNAIIDLNNFLNTQSNYYSQVYFFDALGLQNKILGALVIDPSSTHTFSIAGIQVMLNPPTNMLNLNELRIVIGNQTFLFTPGNDPHHLILGDRIHLGTLVNAINANMYLEQINGILGTSIPLLTQNDIFYILEFYCPGDYDLDGSVNISDILLVLTFWFDQYHINDLLAILSNWGPSC